MSNKLPVFKKGTCACESIGKIIQPVHLNKRQIRSLALSGNFSKKQESIKTRFLR